jgi:hypothetical protein
MSSPALETLLARLYLDADLRTRFLQQPERVARDANLSDEETRALLAIDRIGLHMAAKSFATKRRLRKHQQPPHWISRCWTWLRDVLRKRA